jgi:hypothetical protein
MSFLGLNDNSPHFSGHEIRFTTKAYFDTHAMDRNALTAQNAQFGETAMIILKFLETDDVIGSEIYISYSKSQNPSKLMVQEKIFRAVYGKF